MISLCGGLDHLFASVLHIITLCMSLILGVCVYLKIWKAAIQLFANKTALFMLLVIINSIVIFNFSEKYPCSYRLYFSHVPPSGQLNLKM